MYWFLGFALISFDNLFSFFFSELGVPSICLHSISKLHFKFPFVFPKSNLFSETIWLCFFVELFAFDFNRNYLEVKVILTLMKVFPGKTHKS